MIRAARPRGLAALAIGAAAVIGAAAAAHPHAGTDRQAALTLGPDGVTLRLTMIPGTDEGPSTAARIDADGDGAISGEEADAEAARLLSAVTLLADGAPVPLEPGAAQAGPPDQLAAGFGLIVVDAAAPLNMADTNEIALRVAEPGEGWFVQPFYASGFTDAIGAPAIDRTDDGVVLRFSAP